MLTCITEPESAPVAGRVRAGGVVGCGVGGEVSVGGSTGEGSAGSSDGGGAVVVEGSVVVGGSVVPGVPPSLPGVSITTRA